MLRGFAAARAAPRGVGLMHIVVVNRITLTIPVEEVVADIERVMPSIFASLEGFVGQTLVKTGPQELRPKGTSSDRRSSPARRMSASRGTRVRRTAHPGGCWVGTVRDGGGSPSSLQGRRASLAARRLTGPRTS